MMGGGRPYHPVLVILGASIPLSLALCSLLSGSHSSSPWVLSTPPISFSLHPFLNIPPFFSLSSRMGRVAVFSHLFYHLPPDRLAVLSSPVPVSLASICSSPFLGSSPILWLLTRLRDEPHLTNHIPSLSLLSSSVFLSTLWVCASMFSLLGFCPLFLGLCPVPPSCGVSAPVLFSP